jgi:hypothetical protein
MEICFLDASVRKIIRNAFNLEGDVKISFWWALTPCSEVETGVRVKDCVASNRFLPEFTALNPRRHHHVNIISCAKQYISFGRLD